MNNTNLTRLKREYDLMKKKPNENFTAYPIQVDYYMKKILNSKET